MPGKYWNLVMDIAVDHGGYVTPSLMADSGVPAVELRKMVSRGTLEAAAHGVYRVPALPVDRYDEFMLATLWSKGRGTVSHDSALLVHELCDINPTAIHITVPPDYRVRRRGADRYVIHHADLAEDDIKNLDGVQLTTIRRTLHDVVRTAPWYLVHQALQTALGRGAINDDEHAAFQRMADGDA